MNQKTKLFPNYTYPNNYFGLAILSRASVFSPNSFHNYHSFYYLLFSKSQSLIAKTNYVLLLCTVMFVSLSAIFFASIISPDYFETTCLQAQTLDMDLFVFLRCVKEMHFQVKLFVLRTHCSWYSVRMNQL